MQGSFQSSVYDETDIIVNNKYDGDICIEHPDIYKRISAEPGLKFGVIKGFFSDEYYCGWRHEDYILCAIYVKPRPCFFSRPKYVQDEPIAKVTHIPALSNYVFKKRMKIFI
jgi:hypothetical protein